MKFRDQPEEREKRFDAIFQEMNGESDRAVAIVGAAWVEEALSDSIQAFLLSHRKSWDRLFTGNGPLATFSAKIDLARLLGITSDSINSDLHIIRHVRNEFAHSIAHKTTHARITFSTEEVRNRCLSLNCVAHHRPTDPRKAFAWACATLNADFDTVTVLGDKVSETFRVVAKGVD